MQPRGNFLLNPAKLRFPTGSPSPDLPLPLPLPFRAAGVKERPLETVEILEWSALLPILALAKARAQRRYPRDLGPASNAGQGQYRRNPTGARQKGWLAASLARCTPLWGCGLVRSLPSTPSASYARATPVFQQTLRGISRNKPKADRRDNAQMVRFGGSRKFRTIESRSVAGDRFPDGRRYSRSRAPAFPTRPRSIGKSRARAWRARHTFALSPPHCPRPSKADGKHRNRPACPSPRQPRTMLARRQFRPAQSEVPSPPGREIPAHPTVARRDAKFLVRENRRAAPHRSISPRVRNRRFSDSRFLRPQIKRAAVEIKNGSMQTKIFRPEQTDRRGLAVATEQSGVEIADGHCRIPDQEVAHF